MDKKQIIVTSLGNILEWFDFGLFIFLAPIIAEKFFPSHDPHNSIIATFSVFFAGFICRPIGGIFFGHHGDTRGRAKALRLSVLIITFSTLLVGILPTYDTIGILAPILFALLRMIQGISIGGEYSGIMIYLAESAPKQQRGFFTSFGASGANIGFLAATLALISLNAIFSQQTISDWAWRLPFIVIGIVGSIISYYRFKLIETPSFSQLKATNHLDRKPFLTVITTAPKQLLKIIGLSCMSATLYYVFFGYMPTYLQMYLGINSNFALTLQSLCLVLMLLLVPMAAICGDLFGRKKMLIMVAIGIMLFAVPCFYLLQAHSLSWIIIMYVIATLLSSFDQGNGLTAVVENCPVKVRYSGIAFSYNLGNALFGGTASLVVMLLTQKVNLVAPGYYLLLMASISLIAASTLWNKEQD